MLSSEYKDYLEHVRASGVSTARPRMKRGKKKKNRRMFSQELNTDSILGSFDSSVFSQKVKSSIAKKSRMQMFQENSSHNPRPTKSVISHPALTDHQNPTHLFQRSHLNPQQVDNVRHSHGLANSRLIDTKNSCLDKMLSSRESHVDSTSPIM